MAVNVILAGTEDNFIQFLPFYKREEEAGNIKIVGALAYNDGNWRMASEPLSENTLVNFFVLSSRNHFYEQSASLLKIGANRDMIVDGAIFQIPGFNFAEFARTKQVHGIIQGFDFIDSTYSYHPRVYDGHEGKTHIELGRKSYIAYARLEWYVNIYVGNFSSISWDEVFLSDYTGPKSGHDYRSVTHFARPHMDWPVDFETKQIDFRIGNDVWIGRGCRLKASKETLTIGDGAVIASDTAVVSSVPPYAIWGGNPGRLIKYRFPKEIIDELLKIKWWDWDISKIYDNWEDF